MSEVKVNKISPRSGTDVTLGDSGDTFTIPAGATINNQGTATNFGATGSASWTTTVKTSTFTAVAGEGYFVNTTGGAVTVNLPAGVAGAVVAVKDYAGTFDTNGLTLVQNGSDKIGGSTNNKLLSTEGIAATLIFIDSTQGWLVTDDGLQSTAGPVLYSVDFLVVAGGASGAAGYYAGGGGAGGYRTSTQSVSAGNTITVTVGDGGATATSGAQGNDGSNSQISGTGLTTITSTGGGGGGANGVDSDNGRSGGSGGGAATSGSASGGSGNTPATTPSQGNNGGKNASPSPNGISGGGGGASGLGSDSSGGNSGAGGAGTANSITGSSVTYAGGGGGGGSTVGGASPANGGAGGAGGGGAGGTLNASGTAATANTGGGGGGSATTGSGGAGGSGVVILSMPLANFSGTTTGSPTEADDGTTKILTFTGTGSYTT